VKPGKTDRDRSMIVSEVPAKIAGTFTKNIVKAAPVLWGKKIVEEQEAVRAVVINTGIANACTGAQGYENVVTEAKAAQKKAEDELDEYIGTSKKDGVYDLLLSALQKYSDRDYTGSADALLDIDSKKLTTKNMKAIYKDLTAKVYPSAGTGLYSKGKNAYWAKDYKTAISYLKKAIKVSDTNRYAYDYLAKAYEGASDQKNAKKTYQTIIEKFPGTSQAINAKSRIDAMGKKSAKSL